METPSDDVTVVSVERIEIAETVYDIQVEHDESFIVAGVVVHNSDICRARDGKRYTLDGKPIGHSNAWLGGPGRAHWQCRSHQVPVIKSWRELGIDLDEAPEGTRSSMNGQVPAETTYGDWLRRQDRAFVEDVLGKTKAKLFLDGDLPIDRFVDARGKSLNIDELRRRDAEAFRRAGLAS